MKIVCIKDMNVYLDGYVETKIKIGDIIDVKEDGHYINNVKVSYSWGTDMRKNSVSLQDYRDFRITLLTGGYKANKRLRHKINTAFRCGDLTNAIKLINKT